tara:strand:- start:675 stop:1046 length:372 start_codon:yes stop_codon:yes gene_type:complete
VIGMVLTEFDELMNEIIEEYKKPKNQEKIQEAVKSSPASYREKVEREELRFNGIEETQGGYRYTKGNGSPSEGEIDSVFQRVDARMLRESPLLIEQKLKFSGGVIIPDMSRYDKMNIPISALL